MPLNLPNHPQNGQFADGDHLEQNFDTIVTWANSSVMQADGSVAMTGPLLLPSGAPTQPNQAASKSYVDGVIPIGTMTMYAGVSAPSSQYMLCQGQALNRTTYDKLYQAIGTRYGAGNGSTTFNIPNLQATVPVGFNSGTNPPPGVTTQFTVGLGQRYGDFNAIVPAHLHAMPHVHPITHNHASATTSSQSHDHDFRGAASGPSGTGDVGLSLIADASLSNYAIRGQTGGRGHNHTVDLAAFTGNSGAASNGNTASTGESATNANIQPSLAVNFIIKVL